MAISRRKFLASAGTLTAVAAAAPLATVAAVTPETKAHGAASSATAPAKAGASAFSDVPQYKLVSQYQFTPQLFQRLIGEKFQVKGPNGSLVLQLNSVETYPQPKLGLPTNAFAIRFSYVRGTAVAQGTYEVHNPALGDFLLFIVPAAAMQRPSYTAVINHI